MIYEVLHENVISEWRTERIRTFLVPTYMTVVSYKLKTLKNSWLWRGATAKTQKDVKCVCIFNKIEHTFVDLCNATKTVSGLSQTKLG